MYSTFGPDRFHQAEQLHEQLGRATLEENNSNNEPFQPTAYGPEHQNNLLQAAVYAPPPQTADHGLNPPFAGNITPPRAFPGSSRSSGSSAGSSSHTHLSPFRHPSFGHDSPHRNTYLEQVSPLRFPLNFNQGSPLRRRSLQPCDPRRLALMDGQAAECNESAMQSTPRPFPSIMDGLVPESNEGAMQSTPRHFPSAGQLPVNRMIAMGHEAELFQDGESNGGATQATPRHFPSANQLPPNHLNTTGQEIVPFQGGGIRRMSSTPALTPRHAPLSAPGNGPMHTMHIPSHPAAMSHTSPARSLAVARGPAHAKTAEFLRHLKKMVLHAVQINRYKNGLFVTSITPRSDLMNDLNVLINSAQVTGLDNLRLVNVKEGLERIYDAIARGNEVKVICGTELWTVDIEAGFMIPELRDVLNSTDLVERQRWEKTYGNR